MFVLVVELEAQPHCLDRLESLLHAMVALAGQEDGIVFYAAHRSLENPHAFVLYERYKNRADWEAHLRRPEVEAALQQFGTLLTAPPKVTRCEMVCSTGRLGQ